MLDPIAWQGLAQAWKHIYAFCSSSTTLAALTLSRHGMNAAKASEERQY